MPLSVFPIIPALEPRPIRKRSSTADAARRPLVGGHMGRIDATRGDPFDLDPVGAGQSEEDASLSCLVCSFLVSGMRAKRGETSLAGESFQ